MIFILPTPDALLQVRYDLRGQGRSGHPDTAEAHVSKLYADDFAAICNAFGLKRPYHVGWYARRFLYIFLLFLMSVLSSGVMDVSSTNVLVPNHRRATELLQGSVLSDVAAHLPPNYLSGSVYLCGPPFLGAKLYEVVHPECAAVLPKLADETITAATYEDAMTKFMGMMFSSASDVALETKLLWRGMMSSAPPVSYRFLLTREVDTAPLYALGKKGYPLHYIIGTDEQTFHGPSLVAEVEPHFTNFSVLYIEKGGHSEFYQNSQVVIDSITEFVSNNCWEGSNV